MSESSETDALRKELDQLRDDLTALGQTIQDKSKDQIQAGVDKARDCFENLGDEARSRPFIGMLATFGIGLLIGRILSR